MPAPALGVPRAGKLVAIAVARDRVVAETYVRQYEPLPCSLGAPSACDWIGYLRYRARQGPTKPSQADAILVVMPGFLGGSSLFDALAHNVIRKATARHR